MMEGLISWAAQTSIAVSVLIAFVLVVRREFARRFGAHCAYALWALPLMRLIMPTVPLPFAAWPRPWASETAPVAMTPETVEWVLGGAGTTTVAASSPTYATNWLALGLVIWALGLITFLTLQWVRQARIHTRLVKSSRDPSSAHLPLLQDAANSTGLKQVPRTRISRSGTGPLVIGLIQPVVILPANFFTAYSPKQQSLALLHEFAHIRRKDLWTAFAAQLFRAVNWPNPLIHHAYSKFRSDQEAACDATVLRLAAKSAKPVSRIYAETLLHAARQARLSPVSVPMGLTIHNPLKERLMNLKHDRQPQSGLTRVLAGIMLAGALVATAPMTLAGEGPEHEHSTETKNRTVLKWTSDEMGEEVTRHYEILKENGETKAWSIDELGNRTEIDPESIDDIEGPNGGGLRILTMDREGDMDKNVEVILDKLKAEGTLAGEDGETRKHVIVKRMDHADNAFAFSTDENITIDLHGDGTKNTSMMVGVASNMLNNVDDTDLSYQTQQKIEAARKALAEAKEALEMEGK